MDDRDQSDHEELIARSRAAREHAREAVADAHTAIARSRAILERLRKRSPHLFAVEAK